MRPSPSQSGSETSRQAARREKSLNKIPAMQRVAMELDQALSSPLSAKSKGEVAGIKKSIEIEVGESDAGVGFAIGALPPLVPLTNGAFQSAAEDVESDIVSKFYQTSISNPAIKACTNARNTASRFCGPSVVASTPLESSHIIRRDDPKIGR